MSIKITTLIEDSKKEKSELIREHGLSMYINTPRCNIIFDTGSSGNFIKNAEKLNIDLQETNYMILSHAHYDHCGGVRSFIESIKCYPELYISEYFFENSNKFKMGKEREYKYLGIDFDEKYLIDNGIPINYVEKDILEIEPNIFLVTNFKQDNKFEEFTPNMVIKKGEGYILDNFKEEMALVINTYKGLVVLAGCSHVGIVNILSNISKRLNKKIYAVLGGTHLIKSDENRVKKTIDALNELDIDIIGVSHCTGEFATTKLKELNDKFFLNDTGNILEI
ncbi:MBL fold metallo-hydrolase [Clostridium sporogenes]|uniref:MBL fold metallo-hydrolase n=1 Tax=unclassified Clostridium TaxID=2614128 RepID=UPI0013D4FE99|nr:MBL fold metallo-hydrolase [Clostridium botulinum]NFN88649.1 MBL fold metallo-hydrolase [Clostridium sporogenes]NFS27203.1 MBL fold metallo-hydrolase [Clostridium sporogenes]